MIRGVLFDFDGTLIDTWRLYFESFRRSLVPHFQRSLSDAEILRYQPIAERRFLRDIVEPGHVSNYFDAFLSHYRSLYDTHCDGMYDGIRDMLEEVRNEGLALGVVTGKSRHAWDTTSSHVHLDPFDVVITDDDVTEPKPHPEGLLAALHAMKLDPSEALYVGDSLHDCRAAHAAKIRFGAALWSKSEDEIQPFRKTVATLGAAEFCTTPAVLLSLVRNLNGHGR